MKVAFISTFPLLPKITEQNNWNIFYYIDATYIQLFEDYECFKFISNDYKNKILNKEKEIIRIQS